MKDLIKTSTICTTIFAMLLNASFTSYAAPPSAYVVDVTGEDGTEGSDQTKLVTDSGEIEAPPESSGYYLYKDLPDIVAVNRFVDDEWYGNESYFLRVDDLIGEKSYFDNTGKLTCGENYRYPNLDPNEQLKIHGGQELRITIFYDNNTQIPLFPSVGSGFFPSLKTGETGTIWGQVYLLDSVGFTNSGIGGEDRVYNVVPIIAEEDVYLEYVEDSLIRYGFYEDLEFRNGTPITGAGLKYFFQEDIEEPGLQMIYFNNERDDPREYAGYVTYKIKVIKQPNNWDKAEAATNTAKDKVSELWHSEPAEKAKEAFTDFMTGLGDQASAWLNR